MPSTLETKLTGLSNKIKQLVNTKANKTNGASEITDSNSDDYTHIASNMQSGATQATINDSVNIRLGQVIEKTQTDTGFLKSDGSIDGSNYYTEDEIDAMNCGTFAELATLIGNANDGDVISLTKDYKNTNNQSVIAISKDITIEGNGHLIDGNNVGRIFTFSSNAECIISNCHFKNGKATAGNQSGGAIGYIYNCVISDCTFEDCHGVNGSYGGAIDCMSSNLVYNCAFIHNSSPDGGGAIRLYGSSNTIRDCIFVNNSSGYGGAIHSANSSNYIYNCQFYSNSASSNPNSYNVYCQSGTLTIYNTNTSSGLSYVTNKNYLTDQDLPSGITLDNNVTQNSSNAVKSSGIYTALSGKSDTGHGHTTSDISDWLNKVYPVGSIYMSVSDVNPSTLFGGTWAQLTNTFLYASTTADADATTAPNGQGEATHSLTASEMPRHTHTQNAHNHTQSSHSHGAASYKFFESDNVRRTGTRAYTSNVDSGPKYLYHNTSDSYALNANTKGATPTINDKVATNRYTGGDSTGDPQSASNGIAHNNMPPYMKVYMWKRTA